MANTKAGKKAAATPTKQAAPKHTAGPDLRCRCRVCGSECRIKSVIVDGLQQHTAPANCPNCGRILRYDIPGPWKQEES